LPPESGQSPRLASIIALCLLGFFLVAGWFSGGLGYGLWWLTNSNPPALALAGPADVVRGTLRIGVQLSPGDRARIAEAQVDGRPVDTLDPLTVETTGLADGPHRLTVVAEDQSLRRNRATAELDLRTDNTPPRIAIETRPASVPQGRTWLLRVRADEPAETQASLGNASLQLQPGEGFGWAVVGIGAEVAPTSLPMVVTGGDLAGNQAEQRASVEVTPAQFTRDSVQVSAALLPLLQPQVRREEDDRLAPTYAQVTQPRLWDDLFVQPVQGTIITQFGEVRSYNGGPFEGHHGGTDFAAPAGRPVVAPARARVALVDQMRLRGNIVVLDHGLGVFTTYTHLSSTDVRVGQELQRGQAFARVGSTGLSEGPHLHWELWVGRANVDPMEWVEQRFP
jgi:hypothetical protein